ncbi:MAG: ABC transporter ATP-binding protein, partial [Burkholderiaceae bacterium]
PTEGLAPMIVELVGRFLRELQQCGLSILLIEQKLTIALAISQRVYVMGHGHMVFEGSPASLMSNKTVRQDWLEV